MPGFWRAAGAISGDARVAMRYGRRRPTLVVAIVTTLALTIGANIAVFSVVNAVLVRALPFADADRLAYLTSIRPDAADAPFTLPEFLDYRAQTRSLAGLAAYANWSANLALNGTTERLQGARMSANAFDVLGVSPAAGRLLRESDDRADAPAVAVISHRLWQRAFGGAADVVGTPIRMNSQAVVIVGVMPPQFILPLRDIDVVVPLVPDRDPLRTIRSSTNFLRFIGRLKPGVTMAAAQAELTEICRSLRQRFPVDYARKDGVRVVALQDVLVGGYRQSMLTMLGAVATVLGAALANLVALVLVRASERRSELAVRVAIGASRVHLARQLIVEAMLLTLAGSTLGWLLAGWLTSAALRFAPASIPRLSEVSADGRVVMFAVLLMAVVAATLSLAPLAAVFRADAGDAFRAASRGALGDRSSRRVRAGLVVVEVAAALVLLLATTVLIRTLVELQHVQPGFTTDQVFQARVSLPPAYRTPEDVARFYERLSDRLAAVPGVEHAGLTSVAPLSGLLVTVPFGVVGQPPRSDRDLVSVNLRAITPGYLDVVGTRLIQGRPFAETDRAESAPVALVSAALAQRFLADRPVGREVTIDDNSSGPRPVEVVGVVEDVRQTAIDQPPTLDVYIPLRQVHPDGVGLLRNNQFWMVRTDTAPEAFRQTFLTALRAVDQDAAIASSGAMQASIDVGLAPRRFNLGLFVAFSLTSVLLAVLGVYGLVSFAVSQQEREIGLRMALGASERDVLASILRKAVWLGVAGAATGLALAFVVRPLVGRLAPVDLTVDPLAATATTALLVVVVTIAAWVPARRAARVEPTIALRQ